MCSIDVANLQWVESTTYSDVFRISGSSRDLRVSYYDQRVLEEVLKTNPNKRSGVLETDPIRIENKMALITDSLVKNGFEPHYIHYIKNEDCKNVLTRIAPALPHARRINAKNKDLQKRYNNVKVFQRMKTMTQFMRENKPSEDDARDLIFQVLYGLGVLQHYIKDFKHGNLTTDTVMIEMKRADHTKINEYPWPGNPLLGYPKIDRKLRVRITGFEYASGSRVFVNGLEHLSLKNSRENLQSKEDDVNYFFKSFFFKNFDCCPKTSRYVKLQLEKSRRTNAPNQALFVIASSGYLDSY